MGKKTLSTCNKKQTYYVGGKKVTSHLLPALPRVVAVVVVGETLHYKEWIKAWMQRGALDALRFYEAASKIQTHHC